MEHSKKKIDDLHSEQSKEARDLERLNKYLGLVEDDKKVQMKEGYPTIFKVVDGVVEYYNGPRITQSLVNWVKETTGGTRKRSIVKQSIKKRITGKRRTNKSKRNTRRR